MSKLATLFAIALIAGHPAVAQARELFAGPQAAVQMASYPSDNGAAPSENPQPGADTAGGAAPAQPARPRGQPRVSKTRCAFVTCEAPCEAETTSDTPVNAPAAPRRAPCPARQALS